MSITYTPPPSGGTPGDAPGGAAGGLLGGTYPNPTTAAGNTLIKSADVDTTLKDPAAATAGLRSLDTDIGLASNSDTKVPSQKATKAYIDSIAAGLTPRDAVRLATAAALPTNARVGSVLTATANGALTVDGQAVVVGDRILVKNEATGANNGVYVVTATGSGILPYILTRTPDLDITTTQVESGLYYFVGEGTANAGAGYVLTSPDPVTINTTALTFTQFSGAGEITAGTGLAKSGNTLSIASGGVSTTEILDGTIATADIAAGAVTDAKTDSALPAYAAYKTIRQWANQVTSALVAGTYAFQQNNNSLALTTGNTGIAVFYFDPAAWTAGLRTTKLRVQVACLTNSVAPAITMTVGLYPVTACAGAAGSITLTLGTVTTGSTVAFASPSASTLNIADSGDFTAPSAGHFALGVVTNGTNATNNLTALNPTLQVRQV